jgi:lipopolysaccharide heptosyltransferase I
MTRLLVVKLSSLGDLFHALPAVRALRQGLDARVDWVVHSTYRECVERFKDVDRAIPFERRAFWSTLPMFWRELRRERYDLVLDLQGNLKSAMVSRLARGRRLVGPSFNREGSRWLYPEVAGPPRRDRHAVEQILDTVRHLGLAVGEPAFPVSFPVPALTEPRPRVALIPFSRWAAKNWPAPHFAALGRELQRLAHACVTLLGGREDAAAADALARDMGGGVINRVGHLSLVELGSALSGMDLVIGNDTGPLHMAAALGVPVLGLYGPTNPARTGPFGPGPRKVLTPPDRACAPCYRRCCPAPDRFCLAAIRPETVRDEALAMLGIRP